MRILLIDDSTAFHEEFARCLAGSGVSFSAFDQAMTVASGTQLMNADAHDIYFVDYRLPDDNGLTLVEAARRNGVVKPIVMLTGYDRPEVDHAAERAGANDFLAKSDLTAQTLSRTIRYAVRNATEIAAAREAASLFRMAQEAADIGTWDWDISSNTVTWSPQLYKMFGKIPPVPASDLYGVWLSSLYPDDRDSALAASMAAIAGIAPLKSLFRILRPRPDADPEVRWISCSGDVLRDPVGRPVRMIGINHDVTEQQNALADMRAARTAAVTLHFDSELRFQTYFENTPDCMFHLRLEPDGRLIYEAANPTALNASGLTLDQIRGLTPEEALGPAKGRMMTTGLRQVCATGKPFRYEPTWELPGGCVTYDAVYMPLFNQAKEVTGILGVARDITERRRLQTELHQKNKMQALGQLAGGVAHDFNNVLTAIVGCLDLLARHSADAERAQLLIVEGIRSAQRGKALTTRLLAFSRQQPLTTKTVDVNAAVEEIFETLSRSLGKQIQIVKRLAGDLWPAVTDRSQVELAIMNLAINARDAMAAGGTLTIESRNETVVAPLSENLEPGDYVTISLGDTGSGMPSDILAHALEPFFTTKEAGKGTGLGLSIVYGVMRQLGGDLKITSSPGNGTSVKLYLPRAPAVGQRMEPRPASAPVTILLVDHDPTTQGMVAAFAAELGHTLIQAESAGEALDILAADQVCDILMVDTATPGMPGAELVARCRASRPGLPALLMSAMPDQWTADEIHVLVKPFGPAAFDTAIESALGRPRTATIIPMRRNPARTNRTGAAS